MRSFHFVAAALFLLIAALQFNDPDPSYWVAVYVGTALIAIGNGVGRFSELLTAMVIGAVVAGMIVATPSVLDYVSAGKFGVIFGDMRGPAYVEPAREFGGLLLALCLLVFYVRRQTPRDAGN